MPRKKASFELPHAPLAGDEHARTLTTREASDSESRDSGHPDSETPVIGSPAAARALPVRRPMAQVTRITLFQREVREKLSRAALELLVGRLEVLSEGQRTHRSGRDLYFGSTMITADLARLGEVLRDSPDGATASRLVKLLENDDEARRRLEDIATKEALRIACVPLKAVQLHFALRAASDKVYVDVDVEAEF